MNSSHLSTGNPSLTMTDLKSTALEALTTDGRCSIEMPAGTGKTQMVALIAEAVTSRGGNVLLLTHTNAGVFALTKRCQSMGVEMGHCKISTICAFAERISRSYPKTSGLSASLSPSDENYHFTCVNAATLLARQGFFSEVIRCSYQTLVVDEYQDCTSAQQDFILALSDAVPKTIVLGDRLQRILDFGKEPFPDWESEVEEAFPRFQIDEFTPFRWIGNNEALGRWLLEYVRPRLLGGESIDFGTSPGGVKEVHCVANERLNATFNEAACLRKLQGDLLVLYQTSARGIGATLCKRLGKGFTYMEDLNGSFIRGHIEQYDSFSDPKPTAYWLACLAKECFSGLGTSALDTTVMNALRTGKDLSRYKGARPKFKDALSCLDNLQRCNDPQLFSKCCIAIQNSPVSSLYRKEAWQDGIASVRGSLISGRSAAEEFSLINNAKRHQTRRDEKNVVSRTVLVKGLEYSNVVISGFDAMGNEQNQYVALTRASRALSVVVVQ